MSWKAEGGEQAGNSYHFPAVLKSKSSALELGLPACREDLFIEVEKLDIFYLPVC
jgi:hypothetical protein